MCAALWSLVGVAAQAAIRTIAYGVEQMAVKSTASRKGFVARIFETVLVALCCFTPLLIVTLGAIGLSVLTPYLDSILLLALVIMLIVTAMAYRKLQRAKAR